MSATKNQARPEIIAVRIPSRLELLGILDRITESVCQRLRFDDDTCCKVTMSVIEAGTNAIQHGHKKDASKPVDIEFHLLPDSLEIKVHDSGSGFNVGAVNGDITSPQHIFDARGRGIFIMRSCMDQVDYEFNDSGTTLRLVKNRPAKADDR